MIILILHGGAPFTKLPWFYDKIAEVSYKKFGMFFGALGRERLGI